MKELECPVCAHPSTLEQHCKDADLYRCSECDHCFSDPVSIRGFEEYGPEYFQKNWFKNPDFSLFENLARFIIRHKSNASVLDAGCGNGAFLRYLHQNYRSLALTGIDIAANQTDDGIQIFQDDILDFEFSRQFDVVVSLAVIEHLLDVRAFIKRLSSLCVPGGLLIVMTINDRSVLYGVARALQRIGYSKAADQLYSRHHLNHFNITSLQRLMNIAGFTVQKTLRHNIPMAAVDITTPRSRLGLLVLRTGVWGTFFLGRLIGHTYEQTVMCQKAVTP